LTMMRSTIYSQARHCIYVSLQFQCSSWTTKSRFRLRGECYVRLSCRRNILGLVYTVEKRYPQCSPFRFYILLCSSVHRLHEIVAIQLLIQPDWRLQLTVFCAFRRPGTLFNASLCSSSVFPKTMMSSM